MLKKSLLLIAALVVALGLCACSSNTPGNNHSFSAADLLQTNMDILYRGSYTADTLDDCGITTDDADAMYRNSINTEVDFFCKYFDIDRTLLSDETQARLYDMYTQIYGKAHYTVGNATETADGYTVALSVRPLLLIQDFLTEDADTIMGDWQQKMDAGELDLLTDNEREEAWADGIINAVAARAESNSADYAAPQELTIRITPDADGYLAINDDDMEAIDRLLIEY